MKKIIKIFLAFVLAVFTAFSACSVSLAADASKVLSYEVTSDGYAVVADCDEKAKGVVEIPSKVTINGKSYNVKYIGDKAFDKCSLVTDIRIPEGVTGIDNFAFRNCTALENVYIPESVAMCQYDAFDGCDKMTIHCYTSNYQFFSIYGVVYDIEVKIIDEQLEDADKDETTSAGETDFIARFINALKKMIEDIIANFKDDNSDYIPDLPFLEDLPFDI